MIRNSQLRPARSGHATCQQLGYSEMKTHVSLQGEEM